MSVPSRADASIRIRRTQPEDLEAAAELYAAVAAEGIYIGAEAPVDTVARRERWRKDLDREDSLSLVAEADGEIIGLAGLDGVQVADLGMLVAREWRGRGIGTRLLRACIAWARERGAHKISLQAWPHNEAALRLYKAFGFEEEGYLRKHYRRRNGQLWDAVIMGLLLAEDPQDEGEETSMANDWNDVRYDLDDGRNYSDIYNSPWYSDAEYNKFSPAEYDRRHQAARALMVRDGLDALILTGGPNIYSLGSAVTWGCGLIDQRGMCQYLVLPHTGEPTLVYPHPGCHLEAVRRQVAISDVRAGDGHFGRVIATRLGELDPAPRRVGITAADTNGPEYMGVAAYQELESCLPGVELVFCPGLWHELTYRKGAEELGAIRRGGELAIASLEAIAKAAQAGRREYELAAAGTEAILAGGGQVHLMMIGATAMSDPRLMYPNPNPSHRTLREGDIVLTEIAAAYLGYSAKIGHPITIGEPTPEMKRMYRVSVEVLQEIEGVLGPGVDLVRVQEASGGYRRAGMQSRPTTLHGIDLITAGPKVSVGGVSSAGFDDQLLPGMVVNIESTPLSRDGVYGQFLSRTYAIDENGIECLTPYPTEDLMTVG